MPSGKKKKPAKQAPQQQVAPVTPELAGPETAVDSSNSQALEALATASPGVDETSLLGEAESAPAESEAAPVQATATPVDVPVSPVVEAPVVAASGSPGTGKKKKKKKGGGGGGQPVEAPSEGPASATPSPVLAKPQPQPKKKAEPKVKTAEDWARELMEEEDTKQKAKTARAEKIAAKKADSAESAQKAREAAVATAQRPVNTLIAQVSTQRGRVAKMTEAKADEDFFGSYLPLIAAVLPTQRRTVTDSDRELNSISDTAEGMLKTLQGNPKAKVALAPLTERVAAIKLALDAAAAKITEAKNGLTQKAAHAKMAELAAVETGKLLKTATANALVAQAKKEKWTGPTLQGQLALARQTQRTKDPHEWAVDALGFNNQNNLWIGTADPVLGVTTHQSLFKDSPTATDISMDSPTSTIEASLYGAGASALHVTPEFFPNQGPLKNPHTYFGGLYIPNDVAQHIPRTDPNRAVPQAPVAPGAVAAPAPVYQGPLVSEELIEQQMQSSLDAALAANRANIEAFKQTPG